MERMENFMAVTNQNNQELLGKFVYFSLANVLVEKSDMEHICHDMQFPYEGKRISVIDAFRNATGSITDRIVTRIGKEQHIVKIYCRDNRKDSAVYSRELVRETIDHQTNCYEKLANICYNAESDSFYAENISPADAMLDPATYCEKAAQLFTTYRHCLGRSQIDTIVQNFLGTLDALPISIHGKFYFIPRSYMEKVDVFEDFIAALNDANRHEKPLIVNSFLLCLYAKYFKHH